MYIWQKTVSPSWLQSRNEELTQRFATRLALVERPGGKRSSLEISCRTMEQAQAVQRKFGGKIVKLQHDWLQQFARRARGKPLRIGSRLVIVRSSPKRSARSLRRETPRSIVIPAESAFGTGEHATTAMCLRLLEQVTRRLEPGWRMLDAGTGSGILAIAGSHFGAGRVLAVDCDPLACAIAKRNARVNGVRHIAFSTGDIVKQRFTGKFEIISANLFSEILIEALPIWSRLLAAGGHMILSGILRSQESSVVRAIGLHRFIVEETRRRGKWVALLAKT